MEKENIEFKKKLAYLGEAIQIVSNIKSDTKSQHSASQKKRRPRNSKQNS